MSAIIVVTGTDTDVGKTVFCAGLTRLLDGAYWKPVQAGLDGETDSEAVQRLSALPEERIHPEGWRLRTPASPHWAAELDHVAIDPQALRLPEGKRPLIVEGVGGLMVPLTRHTLFIDVLARWGADGALRQNPIGDDQSHAVVDRGVTRASNPPAGSRVRRRGACGQRAYHRDHGQRPSARPPPASRSVDAWRTRGGFRQGVSPRFIHEFQPSSMIGDPHSPIWHPFTQHALRPNIAKIVRAEGAYLFTAAGERVIDAISSLS